MDAVLYFVGAPLLATSPLFLGIAVLVIYKRWERSKNRRNPLTRRLLNAPGASLRARLMENEDDLTVYLAVTVASSFYAAGLIVGQRAPQIQSSGAWLLGGLLLFAVVSFFVHRILRLFRRIRRQRLGLDGELATAEELNRLLRHGYHVYHDIPGPNYNVDHVAVGKNGVFALETKTHSKPAAGYEAEFDGRRIQYPDRQDFDAVRQAKRNATTLGKYLSGASGRTVRVQPVVVLPGWFVKTTAKPDGIVVLGSGQLAGWLPRLSREALTSDEISAISHQLDRLCRCESPLALSDDDVSKFERKLTI